MSHDSTLLAYLVSSFPGNTENIATEALRHLFDRSDACREALNDVVQSGVRELSPINRVDSQVINADGTIPDLVGFDENHAERALIEVKFWAGLTSNQPNRYIDRLPKDGPAVVIFLVPEERIQSLWPQLKERLNQESRAFCEIDSERKTLRVGNTGRHLMIASWGGLLDSMAARTADFGESGVLDEIRQLRSLAKYADEGAFKPIKRGEEFGVDSETRMRQYQRLVDAATERGIEHGWANRKGLNRTTRPYGYGRYVKLGETVVWFGVNRELFESSGNTPLWVDDYASHLRNKPREVRERLGLQAPNWVPVTLKRGVEFPEMLDGVVESLKSIADALHPND